MTKERKYLAVYDDGDHANNQFSYWSTSRNGSKANLEDAYRTMRRKYGNRGGGKITDTMLDN